MQNTTEPYSSPIFGRNYIEELSHSLSLKNSFIGSEKFNEMTFDIIHNLYKPYKLQQKSENFINENALIPCEISEHGEMNTAS